MVQNVYIPGLDGLLISHGVSYMARTVAGDYQEYLGLLDMYYSGGPKLFGNGIYSALDNGDRADVWFEIRYNSNKDRSAGEAKRRDYDAQLFGLFSNPSAPSSTEVIQAYQMLTQYRSST